MGSRKNNKSRNKKGGHSPYTVNVTGYYKPDNGKPGKLVDIVVNNKQDSDKYFNTYKVYPDEPTLINDLKDFVNIDNDEIENMNYRLKPFFDAKPDENRKLIPKQRIIVVNDDKDMAKIKTANEIIEKLNEMQGGSLFKTEKSSNQLSEDQFLALKPEDLDKYAPGDIGLLTQNKPNIIKQLQKYYLANIVKEKIYTNNDNFKNLLKTNAFFNIIAKKTGLINEYIPLKFLDETKKYKNVIENVIENGVEKITFKPNTGSSNNNQNIFPNVLDTTRKNEKQYAISNINSANKNLNNEISKILGTDLKSSLVKMKDNGMASVKNMKDNGMASLKNMGDKGMASAKNMGDKIKDYGINVGEKITSFKNSQTRKIKKYNAIDNLKSANDNLNNEIAKVLGTDSMSVFRNDATKIGTEGMEYAKNVGNTVIKSAKNVGNNITSFKDSQTRKLKKYNAIDNLKSANNNLNNEIAKILGTDKMSVLKNDATKMTHEVATNLNKIFGVNNP